MTGAGGATAGVAITGIGILTPLGDDLATVGAALRDGRRSVAATADLPEVGESRLADFEATRYANVRGMRLYNRTTRLGICAAKLALTDAGLDGVSLPGAGLGLILASTFAHLDTLIEYDRSLVAAGIQQTNPALMPLAIPSAPGATMALAFGAKAFSITISNEGASGLDALGLAVRLLESGRAAACLVVGAFSACRELSLANVRAGRLAPAAEFRVFDARHRGTVLGEASAAVVLERRDHAAGRNAVSKGLIRGQASTFAPGGRCDQALHRACTQALGRAGVDRSGVGLVSAGANGIPAIDRAEAQALGALFSETGPVPVVAIKANLGDTVDAGGLVQTLVALDALRVRKAPPIAGFSAPAVSGPAYVTEPTALQGDVALVTATSPLGACAAVVLSLGDGR